MVRIGIVGIGFMGMIHYLAASKVAEAKVVALSSRNRKKLEGDWTSIQGNFGPRGTQMDLSGHAVYENYADLLADPNIDLVDLCVPNADHARYAIQALEAGKNVLVEKPIALTTADADAMVAASRASGKLLMVAHVLPFFPEFAYAAEAIRSKRFGALKAAHLTRVIARPQWSADIADSDKSGGPAIDLHIHDNHYVALVCGVPKGVHTRGVEEDGAVTHLSTQYIYDDRNLSVSAVSGALSQPGRPFTHGFDFYLEKATLSFAFASVGDEGQVFPLTVSQADGTNVRPSLGASDPIDAFVEEIRMAAKSVEEGAPHPGLSGELARQALVLCHAEIQSARTGNFVSIA